MSNSSLVSYTRISPNKTSPRNHVIDTITIHCMAGNLSVETCGNVFAPASRKASSNYGIGSDGRIALYVDEKDRSWCSSNSANDNRAVTIEVANDGGEPDWHVSDRALNSLIRLCADICKRNNIKKLVWSTNKNDRVNHLNGCNMTVHRDYAKKACPGQYLYDRHGYIADEVNYLLGVEEKPVDNKELFIEEIAKAVRKVATDFGIKVYSPIIAQACLESAYGTSELAVNAHNYFGLKWRENRVPSAIGIYNKVGSEQNADGSYVSSAMKWCKFDSLEAGVRGYFEFINISRYNNLKGVTEPKRYLELIKEDGYATSLKYVDNVYNVIVKNNLQRFDNVVEEKEEVSTNTIPTCPFKVKVSIKDLNIRAGAGTNYNVNKVIPVGIYTIIEIKQGKGSRLGWGKLKSGAGWISLDFCEVLHG